MSAIAAAIAGAAVVGAGASIYAGNKAAGAQRDAANKASSTQLGMFNQIQQNEQPWVQTGQQASDALSRFYGLPGSSGGTGTTPDYQKLLASLPGYQFQLDQGSQAVDRNLAARGLLQSGAAGKALTQYGQGVAQNYAGQYTGGLATLSQLGQAGAAGVASAGINTANQVGANQIYAGNAAAAGYANTGNTINAGLSGLSGAYGLYSNNANASSYNPALTQQWNNQTLDQFANQPVAPINLGMT